MLVIKNHWMLKKAMNGHHIMNAILIDTPKYILWLMFVFSSKCLTTRYIYGTPTGAPAGFKN